MKNPQGIPVRGISQALRYTKAHLQRTVRRRRRRENWPVSSGSVPDFKASARTSGTHKERDEDGGVHREQCQDGGPAIAQTVCDRTCGEDAYESTALTRLEQGTLPSGRNRETRALDVDTILVLESGQGDKVSVEKHVERLHHLGGCVRTRLWEEGG